MIPRYISFNRKFVWRTEIGVPISEIGVPIFQITELYRAIHVHRKSQAIRNLRGQGGLGSKFCFAFILLVLKLWNTRFQELFTELKKLFPLLRYGASKLGPISQKIAKFWPKFDLKIPKNERKRENIKNPKNKFSLYS